jgi:hypothetical protein
MVDTGTSFDDTSLVNQGIWNENGRRIARRESVAVPPLPCQVEADMFLAAQEVDGYQWTFAHLFNYGPAFSNG